MFKVAPPSEPRTTTKAAAGKKRELSAVVEEAEKPEATIQSPSPPKRARGRPKKTLNAVNATQLSETIIENKPVNIPNRQSQRTTRAAVGISTTALVPTPAPALASIEVVIPYPPPAARKTRGRPKKATTTDRDGTEPGSCPTTTITTTITDAQMQAQLQAQTKARVEDLAQESETKTWNMHSFTLMMHPAEEEGGRPVIFGNFELVPARIANPVDGDGGPDVGADGVATVKGKGKGKGKATAKAKTTAKKDINEPENGFTGPKNGVKGFEVQVVRTSGSGEEEEMVMLDELDGRAKLRVDFRGEVI
jgi:hypothetical protein